MKEEIKCYCGHTTYCDCGLETLEEAAERYTRDATIFLQGVEEGIKEQQERSYSEEELLEILASYADWSINDIRGWFEQFKKK